MTINEAKENNLSRQLNLTGYALSSLSILVTNSLKKIPNSLTGDEPFTICFSSLVLNQLLPTFTVDFLIKNNYLKELSNRPGHYIFSETTKEIFKNVLYLNVYPDEK